MIRCHTEFLEGTLAKSAESAISSVVERLLHTQEVAGSNPASRTLLGAEVLVEESRDLIDLRTRQGKAMTFSHDDDEVRFHTGSVQKGVQLLALFNGHQGITVAVEKEGGRGLRGHEVDRTAGFRQGGLFIDGAAEQFGQIAAAAVLIRKAQQVRRRIHQTNGANMRPAFFFTQKGGEMTTGRGAGQEGIPRIEMITGSILPKPLQSRVTVLILRGIECATTQAILDGGNREAALSQVAQVKHPAFIAILPASAMNPHHQRIRPRASRQVKIEMQVPPGRRGIDQIMHNLLTARRRRERRTTGQQHEEAEQGVAQNSHRGLIR